jgi:hypothetical protein
MAGYYDEETGNWVDTGSGEEVDTGSSAGGNLDNTSGTGTVGDYTNTQMFDDGSTLITDKDGNIIGSTPSTDTSYTGGMDIGSMMAKLGTSAFNKLKGAFTKTVNGKEEIDWRSVAGAAGGLYGLYQSQKPQEKTGYQGGIPKYTAVREQATNPYDATRRPGSTAQKSFTDTKYVAPADAAAARTTAKTEAAGLETLNKANPARQERPVLQAGAEKKEAAKVESKPASSVVDKLPVPKYASGGIADMAQGRYLDGATDGMADKIPARIGGKQEAKLSHGEFVIPADVVGHLGNGNSEAGAQRLYAMMDKIRKARTGSTKQGKQINPDKFLA